MALVNVAIFALLYGINFCHSFRVHIHTGDAPLRRLDNPGNPLRGLMVNITHGTKRQSWNDFYYGENDGWSQSSNYPVERPGRSHRNARCVQHFCEEVEDYPEREIENALSAMPFARNLFKNKLPINLDNRGNFDHEETMCAKVTDTHFPKKAKNLQNVERFIVNFDKYKQGIQYELCAENTTCKYSKHFPTGVVSRCKQNYRPTLLFVYEGNKSNGSIIQDFFDVPSCCVCVLEQTRKKK